MKDLGFTSGGRYVVKTMVFFDKFNSSLGISMTIVSISGRSIVILSLTSYLMSLLINIINSYCNIYSTLLAYVLPVQYCKFYNKMLTVCTMQPLQR